MLPNLLTICMAVPWLREFVTDLFPKMLGFGPRPVCVGFEVDKVVLVQVFLKLLQFLSVNIIQPLHIAYICHCHYVILAVDSISK
jgi:hypothetical protein